MFRIGEFSKLVRISPRMLRHYEKCGLLYPAEIDRFTGYRQYSAAQIPLLMNIASLRDLGFSIDEIGDILPRWGDVAYMDGILAQKSEEVEASIYKQREKLRQLKTMRRDLTKEKQTMEYDVILKELPGVTVLSLRETIPSYDKEGMLWHKLGQFMATKCIPCASSEESGYSIYHDEEHKEVNVDVEIAALVEKAGKGEGPFVYKKLEGVPLAATLRFGGPYDGYSEASSRLAAWIEANGYEMCGTLRGAAIRTPADQSDPQNFLTEIQIPVRKG